MTGTINIDLKKDIKESFEKELVVFGHKTDKTWDFDRICIVYFNLRQRVIYPQKREVVVSKELSCRKLTPDQKLAIQEITNRSLAGESLIPYQSRKLIKNLEFNDGLLNDWGIHHLHLGTKPCKKKPALIEGTKHLLYCFITDTKIYLLEVLAHKEDFADPKLFEILVSNWPNETKRYTLNEISPGRNLGKKEIKELRESGVNGLVSINGVVYGPPGGGISTSGLSTRVRMDVDQFIKHILDRENFIKQNPEIIRKEIRQARGNVPKNLEFKLYPGKEGIRVKEINSNMVFRL